MAALEMAAGERGLDRALARAEPVERAIELDLVDRPEPEPPAQARAGGVGGQIARSGELGGGRDQAKRLSLGLPSRRSRPILRIVPHRGGVAVRQRAADAD